MVFSTVLAWRVGVLWHSHTGGGGETWCPPGLVQVNGTPISHGHGLKWCLARSWLGGWVSCDTPTPGGGGNLVSPRSCSSQRYSNLSRPWLEMVFSTVLAWRVGVLWHSHTGGGGKLGVPPGLVQVNGTLIFHWYGRKWLLARCWHAGWESCDTPTPGGGGTWCPPCLVQVNGTLIFHWYGRKWLLARCWHAGWESCDTPTPGGGGPGVPPVLFKSTVL